MFLVQGASGGLGLQLCQELLRRTAGTVIATCRQPARAHGLAELAALSAGRLHTRPLDLQAADDAEDGIDTVATWVGREWGRVDLLVNASGVLHAGVQVPGPTHPHTPAVC